MYYKFPEETYENPDIASLKAEIDSAREFIRFFENSGSAAVTNASLRLLWTNDRNFSKGKILLSPLGLPVLERFNRTTPLHMQRLCNNGREFFLFTFIDESSLPGIFMTSAFERYYSVYAGRLRIGLSDYLALSSAFDDPQKAHELSDEIKNKNLSLLSGFQNREILHELVSFTDAFEYLDTYEVLRFYLENVSHITQANGMRFTASIEKALLLRLDMNMLKYVISNLLVNSFIYNKNENKTAHLEMFSEGTSVFLTICDNAGGLSERAEKGSVIPFYDHGSGGEGLGLYIVRQFARALGGSILFTNENGGLKVTVRMENILIPVIDELRSPPIIPYPTLLEKEYVILAKGMNIFEKNCM